MQNTVGAGCLQGKKMKIKLEGESSEEYNYM